MKAFPTTAQSWDMYNGRDLSGMDLRDYFAAQAMQRLVDLVTHPKDVAAIAYKQADAMMEARDR